MTTKVALVTGGSRGIGRAIVAELVDAGLTVAFTWCSNRDAAAEVEREHPGRAVAFQLDLAERARPDALVAEVEAGLGPVEALVNNAAIERHQLLAMTTDASWDEMMDINLGGPFRCTRAALRTMVGRRRGAIVNIASLSALRGVAGHSAYAAAKAGLVAMTRCVAREMGRRGIRVNAVVPGYVATDLTAGLSTESVAVLREHECLPPGVQPRDVAGSVRFLLSAAAAGITGQILTVDAGTSA